MTYSLWIRVKGTSVECYFKMPCKPRNIYYFYRKRFISSKKELLSSAARNAREKAEILCEASNAKLGALLTINYDWKEVNIFSGTDYKFDKCSFEVCEEAEPSIDINPENIESRDTATFIWEIV